MITLNEKDPFADYQLDKARLGTDLYRGEAYFWCLEYKHLMRALRPSMRKKIHDRFLRAGLALDGESAAHKSILDKFCNRKDVAAYLSKRF